MKNKIKIHFTDGHFQCMNRVFKIIQFCDGIDSVWNNIVHIPVNGNCFERKQAIGVILDSFCQHSLADLFRKYLHIISFGCQKTRQEMDIWNPCQFLFCSYTWNMYADENSIYRFQIKIPWNGLPLFSAKYDVYYPRSIKNCVIWGIYWNKYIG